MQAADPHPCLAVKVAWTTCELLEQRGELMRAEGHSCGGKSIVRMLEDELDEVVGRLMSGAAKEDGRDPGRAEGLALAVAFIHNPYRPSLDAVRQAAKARFLDQQRPKKDDEKAGKSVAAGTGA